MNIIPITGGFWNTDPRYPYLPHAGVDYGADIGEEVTAYDDYEVIGINSGHSDYGKHVFLYFPKINKTGLYAHLSRIDVSLGQKGNAQSMLGLSGNTGKSSGLHLHFGLANGKVTTTDKGSYAGDIWLNFEDFNYQSNLLNFKKEVNDTAVQAVIDGKYGNGSNRVAKLESEGLNPEEVQRAVNAKLSGQSSSAPKPVNIGTGQTLVIYGSDLQGSQEVELLRSDKTSYGKGSGITCDRGQIKKYKILEEIEDGFYKIHVPNANPQTVYVKWREGIGFEGKHMEDFLQNILTLGAVFTLLGGILLKQLKATNETNFQLERLNSNMEHQFTLVKKDVNNNFAIVDDNFGIMNGELVVIKRAVFNKDKDDHLPLRITEKI